MRSVWQSVAPRTISDPPVWVSAAYEVDISTLGLERLKTLGRTLQKRLLEAVDNHPFLVEFLKKDWQPEQSREPSLEGTWAKTLLQKDISTERLKEKELVVHCTGLGGGSIGNDDEWSLQIQCSRMQCRPPVYGPTLATQDDWERKVTQLGRTSHIHEFQMAMLAFLWSGGSRGDSSQIGVRIWKEILQYSQQSIDYVQKVWSHRTNLVLQDATIEPAHRRRIHPAWNDTMRLFLNVYKPGAWQQLWSRVYAFPESRGWPKRNLTIRGHSAGSLSGLALEKLLAEMPEAYSGETYLAAIACRPELLVQKSFNRGINLAHFVEDRLCLWRPSTAQLANLRLTTGMKVCLITGSPELIDRARHGYSHLLWVALPDGTCKAEELEKSVSTFTPIQERRASSYRLLTWCTYELRRRDREILSNILAGCQEGKDITQLVEENDPGANEDDAKRTILGMVLPTVQKAEEVYKQSLSNLITKFLLGAKLPVLVYLLSYFLPQFQPAPQRQPTKCSINVRKAAERQGYTNFTIEYLYDGEELDHFKLYNPAGPTFACAEPLEIEKGEGRKQYAEELAWSTRAYKMELVEVGRCIGLVVDLEGSLGLIFALVLSKQIKPKDKKYKKQTEYSVDRWLRRASHRSLNIAWLTQRAAEAFLQGTVYDLASLYDCNTTVVSPAKYTRGERRNTVLKVKDLWLLGETKAASEIEALMNIPLHRIPSVMGLNNIPAVVPIMPPAQLNSLTGILQTIVKRILTPKRVKLGIPQEEWMVNKLLPIVEDKDDHVLSFLCAIAIAIITGRLDLAVQGLFGAGKSRAVAALFLAILCLDESEQIHLLLVAKENNATKSFASLIKHLDPPEEVLSITGRLIGDREANRGTMASTPLDVLPLRRQEALKEKRLVITTGGAFVNEMSLKWTGLRAWVERVAIAAFDEAQQFGENRELQRPCYPQRVSSSSQGIHIKPQVGSPENLMHSAPGNLY